MPRKLIFITLIILGSALLLASISFWLDALTSREPDGLGQQIIKWATTIIDFLVWVSAYFVRKNDKNGSTKITVSGGSPIIPIGDNNRNIQVNNGNYVENQTNINITPPSEEELEKRKRKYELRNKHEFEAPRYLYRPIQDTVAEFQDKLEKLSGGYIGVFGPPGSGKSTFLTQTLRTLPVRSVRYYAYVPDAQDPSILRGESINFFHDTTLQIQRLRNSREDRPDPTDRIALNDFFYQQLALLGKDYENTNTKTIILVDGLDHITREQHPGRSLIEDLPLPSAIPKGVYLVLGSQTRELPNLPTGVQNVLSQSERIIWMGKLSPQNVFEIIHQTLPEISSDFDGKIYQIVDGHPLSLIYLLNALFQSESLDNYSEILEGATAYRGNIEDQYFAHWKKIENDLELADFLGLLTRIRGPIPIDWVAKWAPKPLLIKLRGIFGQYFLSDSLGRWEFFHNSFRIFLEVRTADSLPGRSSEQIDREFHLKLAHLYEDSDAPHKWETLYHYYRAGNHKRVIDIAQYRWFRLQVEALRPIDAIETDVRLATKSAGELLDAVALMRFTLLGAALQQRSDALKDTHLPHLLIEVGKSNLAIDYARDGTRLRLKDQTALSFAGQLYRAGLKREAIRTFELAEPLEYLSGRPISGENNQQPHLRDLLSEWVESASLIRGSIETINTIRRIQKEPSRNEDIKDLSQTSLNLQNWLLHVGALSCCERDDWNSWTDFYEALDEKRDHESRYYVLLRTIEHLRRSNENARAKDLFNQLLRITEVPALGTGRHKTSNLLSVAEAACFLGIENSLSITKTWLEKTTIPPLSDGEIVYRDNSPQLFYLHFRYARLRFILEDVLSPEILLQEIEAQTVFRDYDDEETKSARRQLALIAFSLAKLWTNGYLHHEDAPDLFLSKTKWIFDLIELGWASQTATFRLETEGMKAEISKCVVACASKHGLATIRAVQHEFSIRWENEPSVWWAGIQRETILALIEHSNDYEWAKLRLESIEAFMLRDTDLYSRVEECEKQVDAWLRIGETQLALAALDNLIKTARGIYHDEDYQLIWWAEWLHNTNLIVQEGSFSRIQHFINQIISIENNAPGTDDALHICLQALFDLDPQKAVLIFKQLLEQKSIKHGGGISYLLLAALEVENPPLIEIFQIIQNLILPFERDSPSALIKRFIIAANSVFGQAITIELAQQLVNQIEINVLSSQRLKWLNDVLDSVATIGISRNILDVNEVNLWNRSENDEGTLDHHLYLQTGEKLTLEEIYKLASTVEDFRRYLDQEDTQQTKYFEWHELAVHLINNSSSREEIGTICDLAESRITDHRRETYLSKVFSKASSRLLEVGYREEARNVIEKSFSLTRPSGWAANWDGGVKYEIMQQMLAVMGEPARERLVRLYALDLSERFSSPEQIIRYGEDLAKILFNNIPYPAIWPDIEEYLDELFAGIPIQRQSEIETILSVDSDVSFNTPENALAQLLILYLDFPAFPVSRGAIKACIRIILSHSSVLMNALSEALVKHDQLITQCLLVLEIVSLEKPDAVLLLQGQLSVLQESPNYLVRLLATKIVNNISGQASNTPRIDRELPPIYSIALPEVAIHDTSNSLHGELEPVLLGDRAAIMQPLDIEIRELAGITDLSEDNLIYRAAEKFRELEIQRTWLSSGLPLEPDKLSIFLEKTDLMFSHNKPKIAPATQAVAYVAADLYDSGFFSDAESKFLELMFRNYDPNLLIREGIPRPKYIERIGGLIYHTGDYIETPKDWERTLENSLPLLASKSLDGQIVLGEWTHLKRLDQDWPSEERISVMRAASPLAVWNYKDPYDEGVPIASVTGAHASDYLNMTQIPASELVIAHEGFKYEMGAANWLAFNPRIGFDIGWKPVDGDWFCWQNNRGQIMVKSVFWQDGNFDAFQRFNRTEVGYGWLVLMNEEAYDQIRKRFGAIARGGVIRRSLGWLGSIALTKLASRLVVP